MKLRLTAIFFITVLLAPFSASATQCCWSAGQVVVGAGAAGLAPDSCSIKTGSCPADKTEVDCGAKNACKALLPKCCIFKYADSTKKNSCFESADQNYDCDKILPGDATSSSVYSKCSDLPECSGTSGASADLGTTPEFKIIKPKIPLNIPTVSLQDFTNVTVTDGYMYIPFISVFLVGAYKLGVGMAAILAIIMIMVGGFIWIAAAGDSGKIGRAKKMISGAVIGLVLTVGSYVALQTVNPDLVNFTALKIPVIAGQVVELSDDFNPEVGESGTVTTGVNVSTPSQYDSIFAKYAPCAGVTPEVLKAIAQAESGLNASKVNPSGYTGLFQTKAANCPSSVAKYCNDLTNPDNNTAVGAAMIRGSVTTIRNNCPGASAHDQMVMIYIGHNMGSGMLKYVTGKSCNVSDMRQATIDGYTEKWPKTADSYSQKYQPSCLESGKSAAECTGGPKFDYAVKIANKATGISQVLETSPTGTCPY
jgi:hypothetical protein